MENKRHTDAMREAMGVAKQLPDDVVELARKRISAALAEGKASDVLRSIEAEVRQVLMMRTQTSESEHQKGEIA